VVSPCWGDIIDLSLDFLESPQSDGVTDGLHIYHEVKKKIYHVQISFLIRKTRDLIFQDVFC
jgi:hypothetical protein